MKLSEEIKKIIDDINHGPRLGPLEIVEMFGAVYDNVIPEVEKLEQENAELLEALIKSEKIIKAFNSKGSKLGLFHRKDIEHIIEKHTGKK